MDGSQWQLDLPAHCRMPELVTQRLIDRQLLSNWMLVSLSMCACVSIWDCACKPAQTQPSIYFHVHARTNTEIKFHSIIFLQTAPKSYLVHCECRLATGHAYCSCTCYIELISIAMNAICVVAQKISVAMIFCILSAWKQIVYDKTFSFWKLNKYLYALNPSKMRNWSRIALLICVKQAERGMAIGCLKDCIHICLMWAWVDLGPKK